VSEAFVVGLGAFGPHGLDARQNALMTRASKLAPRPTSMKDSRGGRMANVRARSLADGLQGVERLVALAAPALSEACDDAGIDRSGRPVTVFLALPELRPDDDPRYGRPFFEALGAAAGVSIDEPASLFYRAGAVGVAVALERARAHVAARADDRPVVVGAVDSYHHAAVLSWLDHEKRLLSGHVHDGFIPSEGAAFAVVAGSRHRAPRLAKITSAMVARQPAPEPGDAKNGEALSELVRRARAGGGVHPWVVCDVNGERHRVNEWVVTKVRNEDLFDADATLEERICDLIGDAGAATGALALTYVCGAFRLGFARAARALVTLSSEGPDRGCFVVEPA
jgi:3-oxoacyl-[acyl-carrier-protein] synthase-1